MSKKAVVSLGHDALGYTTMAQLDAVKVTASLRSPTATDLRSA